MKWSQPMAVGFSIKLRKLMHCSKHLSAGHVASAPCHKQWIILHAMVSEMNCNSQDILAQKTTLI